MKKEPELKDEDAKLVVSPATELNAEELAVLDAFIRAKRAEARARHEAKDLAPAVLAILKVHKAVDRRGANVRLKRQYEYVYSPAIETLQANLLLACAMERESKVAAAEVKETVAFEDVKAKELKVA